MRPGPAGAVAKGASDLYHVTRAGLLRPERPSRMVRAGVAAARYGALGALAAISAIRHGERTAIVDERGSLTFVELDRRVNALANAWREQGIREDDGVAVLARNHRGLLEAVLAAARLGADVLLLNTDFAAPQLADVMSREGSKALVYDEEFGERLELVPDDVPRFLAWHDDPEPQTPTLERLIASGDADPPPPPGEPGRMIILTSGTTGTPKGANRTQPKGGGIGVAGALLSKIPLRSREPMVISVPMFHALGFATSNLALGLGDPMILERRFDPRRTVELMGRHQAGTLVVVPVMLARILELGPDEIARHDTSRLRIIFCAGSQLPGPLATKAMDQFGDVVYNLYGSTEVAWATIGTPEDLRAAPGSAGRPPLGTVVRLLDDDGREVPQGQTGRIFVHNGVPFEGYTGGGSKEVIDGLMATGDVGHFDAAGRLFIDGRDDDMIVSGGENVFPAEVEELLAGHPSVREAAVIGVEDEQFGQRLKAFVAVVPGAELSEEDVKTYVRENLARYKAPREVEFLEELPRNPTGKVLKRALSPDPSAS